MNQTSKRQPLPVIRVFFSSMSCRLVFRILLQFFQELMSVVLQGLGDFAIAYLDDILAFSPTLEDHLQHLDTIFDRLRKHDLKLKLKKCNFLVSETNYRIAL